MYILLLIIFICFFFLSSLLNFPYIFRNIKVFFCFSTKYYYREEYKLEHPILVSLVRFISFFIICLVSGALLIIYIFPFFDEKNNFENIKDHKFEPVENPDDRTRVKPNVCSSSIYDMEISLYMPFINDAYYYFYDTETQTKNSSFDLKGYKGLFYDDNYDIKVIGDLIKSNENNKVKMIQYDVTKSKIEEDGSKSIINNITILAIKGTSNKKDIYLDLQLYLPSILLNLLSIFSLFLQQKDTYAFGFLEYSLSLPYRLFSQYSIIDGYIGDLLKAYYENELNFQKNIVIVGHSLGGGLSKIFGRFIGKQSISLSGPGVNAFHSLWEYVGSSENFEISAIDLVPDMDLVPRVEVSGGTIYRIICKEGTFDCHGKELSLCEMLIMCGNPNHEQYCKKMLNLTQSQIDAVKNSAAL